MYYVGSELAQVIERRDEGHDRVFSSSSFALSANLEDLLLTGQTNINGIGNASANLLSGNAADNFLNGGAGQDTLLGGTGNDKLDGGAGIDLMQGGMGDDWYYLNAPSDIVVERAGEGIDVAIQGYSSTMRRNVEYIALSGDADLYATGNAGGNGLFGNSGHNTLSGMAGEDGLLGYAGNDVLLGGADNDYLNGGAGVDTMTGGAGADEFDFTAVADCPYFGRRDTITDFSSGDFINLSGIDAIGGGDNDFSNNAFTYIGGASFTTVGQLRFAGGILSGNVMGDLAPDFAIVLTGLTSLPPGWLIA